MQIELLRCTPALDRIVFRFVTAINKQLVALRGGDLDGVVGLAPNAGAQARTMPHVRSSTGAQRPLPIARSALRDGLDASAPSPVTQTANAQRWRRRRSPVRGRSPRRARP